MAYAFPPDLKQLVEAQMTRGGYQSEDELLREAVQALGEMDRRHAELRDEVQTRVAATGKGLSKPLDIDAFKAEARRRLSAEG
jgi:Arc/MetJ-type ribon-helix-helix transcriptional regulator